ncbi:glycosyltransferase [Microbacterium oxydans]|uniref:4'-demethylrebeccamycin synthase n=1 Tax=Microbacterium oxydans TaxID=82380 RepID=A0A0F0LAE8_9MICO|nr:glycosyltransferase [Microbacterium oxydans]KJL29240.1 4'-demethylrebeccamycin synthase [Microbacterium oxydans]
MTEKSVLITSSPLLGHLTPGVLIGAELARRGHRVRVLTGARHRERVERAGLEFVPLDVAADFDDRDMRSAFPQVADLTGIRGLSAGVLEVFSKPVDAQFASVERALGDVPTDVVLSEMLFAGVYPLALLPKSERPRIGILGISPMTLGAPGLPPYGMGLLPATGPIGSLRNWILYQAANRVVLRPAQKYLAQAMRRLTDTTLSVPFFEMPGLGDALIHLGTQGFEYPRPRPRTRLIFAGPLSSRNVGGEVPDWAEDIEGRKVVHVTQGTVANADLRELVVPTVESLRGTETLVVITGGGRPADEVLTELRQHLGELPDNIRVSTFLDYEWLFPRIQLFITNGGYGGVNEALRHAVPVVVVGNTEDKPEVAARVEWSRVGVRVRSTLPSAGEMRKAIDLVLGDPSFRDRAATMSEEIASSPGLDVIEEFVTQPSGAASADNSPST